MKSTATDTFMLRVPVDSEIADSMQSVTHLEIVGLTSARSPRRSHHRAPTIHREIAEDC
jgi:hypothetical protein